MSMLLGNDIPTIIATPSDGANRRLATALNFLLSSNGDTVTAMIKAMGLSSTEKSGFVVDPEKLNQIKN